MQDRFGVAARLLPALEDQLPRGQERVAVEVRRHRGVGLVVGVLLVDHLGHPAQGLVDLLLGDHTVVQPVGDVLRGDPAGRAVLHQLLAGDVRHLGATDPGVDPADDVPEQALQVVLDLVLAVVLGPRVRVAERDLQQLLPVTTTTLRGQLLLTSPDVDLVVVQCMHRGSRG